MNVKNITFTDNRSADCKFREDPSTSKESLPSNEHPFNPKQGKKRDISPEPYLNDGKPSKQNYKGCLSEGLKDMHNEDIEVLALEQSQQPMQSQPTTSDHTKGGGMSIKDPSMNWPVSTVFQHTVKIFTSCILYPPARSAPPPSRSEKPDACRMVFVKGLPDKITADIVKEIFLICGEILTVRMRNKNNCLIKFTNEYHADAAIFLSGYRIVIENKDEIGYSGLLHVDFASDDEDKCESRVLKMNRAAFSKNVTDSFQPLSGNCSKCKEVLPKEKAKLQEEIELLHSQPKASTDERVLVKDEDEKKIVPLLETCDSTEPKYIVKQKELEGTLKEKLALESEGGTSADSNPAVRAFNEEKQCAITESEIRLIIVIAMYVKIYPYGVRFDEICKYLIRLGKKVIPSDIETLMNKFKTIFKEESSGCEKKWKFLGFE